MPIRLTLQPPEIDEANPFGNDILHRGQFAADLKDIITAISDELVIALDSPWGSGKTVFLQRWKPFLKAEGVQVVYVDAFKSDFFGDVPYQIVERILGKMQEALKDEDKTVITELVSKTRANWKELLKIIIARVAMHYTGGLLDLEAIETAVSEGSYLQDLEDKRDKFRDSLEQLATKVREQTGNPLVVIVDELDRCRPDHAVHLLESIKHLFSIPGVCFVLSIHKRQLEESVRSVYGCGDPHAYLMKMIHLIVNLPADLPQGTGDTIYQRFIKRLVEGHGLDNCSNLAHHWEYGGAIFSRYGMSLREMERAYTLIAIGVSPCIQGQTKKGDYMLLVILYAALLVKQPDLVGEFLSRRRMDDEQLREYLGKMQLPTTWRDDDHEGSILAMLMVRSKSGEGSTLYKEFAQHDKQTGMILDRGLLDMAVRKMCYLEGKK